MWKWLHPYAKPERAYRLAARLAPWFGVLAGIALCVGTVWGLGFAPADYQQGDSFRIIYIHVPASIWSMSVYAAMASAALVGLIWQIRLADISAAAMAPIGAIFTVIALVTGATWGKPMWGAWWVWDARLTSELILLFLYIGVMALHNAFTDKAVAGRAAGILSVIGVINLPIIHYSVVWWNTLHQGATISKMDKPAMAPEMLWPLLIMIAGFGLFFGAVTLIRFQAELLGRERQRPWVKQIAQELE